MSFINSRLRRLEETIRGVRRCPECGLSAGGPAGAERIVVSYDADDEEAPEEALPESCPKCGRPEVTLIRVVYDS
jgi:ribosomal protein S14